MRSVQPTAAEHRCAMPRMVCAPTRNARSMYCACGNARRARTRPAYAVAFARLTAARRGRCRARRPLARHHDNANHARMHGAVIARAARCRDARLSAAGRDHCQPCECESECVRAYVWVGGCVCCVHVRVSSHHQEAHSLCEPECRRNSRGCPGPLAASSPCPAGAPCQPGPSSPMAGPGPGSAGPERSPRPGGNGRGASAQLRP